MEGQVSLTIATLMAIIGAIAVPITTALAIVWKRSESKNKVIIELTKSFVESTKDHTIAVKDQTTAVQNNTRVIERLPEQIMLHIKAATKL